MVLIHAVHRLQGILHKVNKDDLKLFGIAMNWPAFLMQAAWIIIGVYGIVHSARARA